MFFFFKQKTAYEMRISDWSSDVCSSDLIALPLIGAYQAANALTAAGLVIATGGEAAPTLANLARLQPVRGRLERAVIADRKSVVSGKRVSVRVDLGGSRLLTKKPHNQTNIRHRR